MPAPSSPSLPPSTHGLSELGQQSLNGGVDIPSCGDECLQVGFAVDEAHGVELLELLPETVLRSLKL